MRDLYQQTRKTFQFYRKLCDIGAKVLLVWPSLPEHRRVEVKKRYQNEDVIWLRNFLKNRGIK